MFLISPLAMSFFFFPLLNGIDYFDVIPKDYRLFWYNTKNKLGLNWHNFISFSFLRNQTEGLFYWIKNWKILHGHKLTLHAQVQGLQIHHAQNHSTASFCVVRPFQVFFFLMNQDFIKQQKHNTTTIVVGLLQVLAQLYWRLKKTQQEQ